jgi:hypothetical protein
MLGFLRKLSGKDSSDQEKSGCSGDPDCPMCQVSDEVMDAFEKENKLKEVTNE